MFTLTQTHFIRPRVHVRAKNNDSEPIDITVSVKPSPSEKDGSKKCIHPLKKFIMDIFKIEEIDYEKFNKENKWAIKPCNKKNKN